jgi:hypothetical protein
MISTRNLTRLADIPSLRRVTRALAILSPDWEPRYYERDVAEVDVSAVYRHEPLTAEMVARLNPDIDLASLAEDIAEIGYPEASPR